MGRTHDLSHMAIPCPMQVSLVTLPPPDQWSENVLTFLKDMSTDHHRMLMLDLAKQVIPLLKLLAPSATHGQEHPAYAELTSVS